jgi:hypothetical protein
VLTEVQRRFPLAPTIAVISAVLFVSALKGGDTNLINATALLTVIAIPSAAVLDRYRRSIRIKYELEGTAKIIAKTLAETFDDVAQCIRTWSVQTQQQTSDWKRNAGATVLEERERIYLKHKRPRCIRGEVTFPAVITKQQELYFLPDAILVVKGRATAALAYQELQFENVLVSFRETEHVPSDATVTGQTWRFVSKAGGPDRRFKNNSQIPICRYGEMRFGSDSGLKCLVQYSKASATDRFGKAIRILQRPESRIESKAITSAKRPKRWPTVLVTTSFGAVSAVLAILIASELSVAPVAQRQAATNNRGDLPSTQNAISAFTPAMTRVPVPRRRHEDVSKIDAGNSDFFRPRSLAECLSIQDVDERVECLEQR